MSTITTEPLSALSTSSAPSTDWTLPSTRAHCLRSPGGARTLLGPLGVLSDGAGAGVGTGGEAGGVGAGTAATAEAAGGGLAGIAAAGGALGAGAVAAAGTVVAAAGALAPG